MYLQDTQKGKDNLNNHDAEKIDIHQQKNEAEILLPLKVKTFLCQRIQSTEWKDTLWRMVVMKISTCQRLRFIS